MLRAFGRNRSGSLPVMVAFLMIPIVVIAGAGVDLMRHEMIRSKLQDSLDRGVLAAASLNQTMEPRETVLGYLKSARLPDDLVLSVTEDRSVNARRIEASASLQVPMTFLGLAGVSEIGAAASSSAEERRQNIELSLLLDISGSMYDNGGIDQLKPAAKDFIDVILREDVRSVTSVSIVPYAGQVSVGDSTVFNFLAGSGYTLGRAGVDAGTSHCFEFTAADYNSLAMPNFPQRRQVPQFTYWNYETQPNKEPWWCPSDETKMSYLSNDPAYLKGEIDRYKLYDGTGTAIAMKWATLLLDPSIRPYINAAANYGVIAPNFRNRPADYTDDDTLKFIVLMTDGAIGPQWRPVSDTTDKVYLPNEQMKTATYSRTLHNQTQTEAQLKALCTAAKTQGVTIFAIGFKLPATSTFHAKLKACATSDDYYYAVDGLDINDAFRSIATAIQKIKLVG